MIEQLEVENKEPLEGIIDCPQQRSKVFHTYNQMLDWIGFARPATFQMNSGVIDGKAAWQLIYTETES